MKKIYLVRHGDYDFRDLREPTVGQGLLPVGVKQAELTADWFHSLPHDFSAIHCSDYVRARQTAEVISSRLSKVSLYVSEKLREYDDVYY